MYSFCFVFFLMIRRPPRSTPLYSSAASDVYKRQDQSLEQLLLGGLRVLEVPLHTVGDLTQVVRWDVRRHADGDPGAAVDQQVREPGGQDDGLARAAVVV